MAITFDRDLKAQAQGDAATAWAAASELQRMFFPTKAQQEAEAKEKREANLRERLLGAQVAKAEAFDPVAEAEYRKKQQDIRLRELGLREKTVAQKIKDEQIKAQKKRAVADQVNQYKTNPELQKRFKKNFSNAAISDQNHLDAISTLGLIDNEVNDSRKALEQLAAFPSVHSTYLSKLNSIANNIQDGDANYHTTAKNNLQEIKKVKDEIYSEVLKQKAENAEATTEEADRLRDIENNKQSATYLDEAKTSSEVDARAVELINQGYDSAEIARQVAIKKQALKGSSNGLIASALLDPNKTEQDALQTALQYGVSLDQYNNIKKDVQKSLEPKPSQVEKIAKDLAILTKQDVDAASKKEMSIEEYIYSKHGVLVDKLDTDTADKVRDSIDKYKKENLGLSFYSEALEKGVLQDFVNIVENTPDPASKDKVLVKDIEDPAERKAARARVLSKLTSMNGLDSTKFSAMVQRLSDDVDKKQAAAGSKAKGEMESVFPKIGRATKSTSDKNFRSVDGDDDVLIGKDFSVNVAGSDIRKNEDGTYSLMLDDGSRVRPSNYHDRYGQMFKAATDLGKTAQDVISSQAEKAFKGAFNYKKNLPSKVRSDQELRDMFDMLELAAKGGEWYSGFSTLGQEGSLRTTGTYKIWDWDKERAKNLINKYPEAQALFTLIGTSSEKEEQRNNKMYVIELIKSRLYGRANELLLSGKGE